MEITKDHKSGYVNIVGSPNVGKSTLMNKLVGERLSIITSKAQTTRHRIMGIVNEPEYQIIYSDTPGVLDPKYKLHQSMMKFVQMALQDADVLLMVVEFGETKIKHEETFEKIKAMDTPLILCINKIDLSDQEAIEEKITYWNGIFPRAAVIPISALHGFNIAGLWDLILERLPIAPPYFPKDELTDKPMRFFMSEIVREKILIHYKKEIPYSCEVYIEEYKEEEKIVRIRAIIIVSRDSQKSILIGHQGSMLKRVGTDARKDMQAFLQKKVFLETFVKVDKNWRDSTNKLTKYGYNE